MAPSADPIQLPAFATQPWQMSYGERMALEGILAQRAPRLAVEIGTAEGGSLRRIAAHSTEVHSFDLVRPQPEAAALSNVEFHTGDAHVLVPEFLARTAAAGRSVDFVLIDGDHSADGVRRDIGDVLASDAVQDTLIVLHDTLNPEVRRGIEAASVAADPKVALFELDLVPGYLARREPYRLQMWGGLGLIVVDAEARRASPTTVRDDRFHELFAVLGPAVEVLRQIEADGTPLDGLSGQAVSARLDERLGTSGDTALTAARLAAAEAEVEALRERQDRTVSLLSDSERRRVDAERWLAEHRASVSWRITEPIRRAVRSAHRRRAT
jgi:hypothetical protein